jgi:hypothetical protein
VWTRRWRLGSGLGDEGDSTTRVNEVAKRGEALLRLVPHADGVDGECGVERLGEWWGLGAGEFAVGVGAEQVLDGGAYELNSAGGNGCGVAPLGLADDDRRVVDADGDSVDDAASDRRQGDAGPAPQLEHPLSWLNVEQVDNPPVARQVRRPVAHDPPGNMPPDAGGVVELGDDGATEPLVDLHASSAQPPVRSRSSV